jgi:hypothetical protein
VPLAEYAGVRPLYGIKTGLNEAFLIDTATRDRLVAEDVNCSEIIKPYLRGQDIGRWHPRWAGLWMIFARRGIEIERYPSVLGYLGGFRSRLEPRPASWNPTPSLREWPGRKAGTYAWYEVQDAIDYYEIFSEPKLVWQEIQFHPNFTLDRNGFLTNNKAFVLNNNNLWLLSVLNSALVWWHNWRYLPHMKDEALTPKGDLMERLPIAHANEKVVTEGSTRADRLSRLTLNVDESRRILVDWYGAEHGITEPSQRLREATDLSNDDFVAEIRKARGARRPLPAAAVQAIREEWERTVRPARMLLAEAGRLERELSDLVNAAYGLTPEEVALMWRTAPPRMPPPGGP